MKVATAITTHSFLRSPRQFLWSTVGNPNGTRFFQSERIGNSLKPGHGSGSAGGLAAGVFLMPIILLPLAIN
jgi:hypothetical protein